MKPANHLILFFLFTLGSCGTGFLDVKPDQQQRTPSTLEDYLGLMDYESMNRFSSHALGIIGADEMYLTEMEYESFPTGAASKYQKNAYVWEDIIYEGGEPNAIDWSRGYWHILFCNLALDGTASLGPGTQRELWELVRGMAFFHRAFNYYNLAQLYCNVYDPLTAEADLGLPLRTDPDVSEWVPRASLKETYARILADLGEAEKLLPEYPETRFRPSKWAVYALLSRVCLQMEDYAMAAGYASDCLAIDNSLMDYNTLDMEAEYPFPIYGEGNAEVIFNCTLDHGISMTQVYYNADTSLLASYGSHDLRRDAFFLENTQGLTRFRGSYFGTLHYFTGLATDEVYLARAEALARLNRLPEALADLNTLRRHRLETLHYTPLATEDKHLLLSMIIAERRRELVMRGTRWEDLRRYNKSPESAVTLVRVLGDRRFELSPGGPKWVWPLPQEAVLVGNYQQNER